MFENETIMFIHGAWVNSKCWDSYEKYFTEAGFKCLTPSWPYKEGPIEELNTSPNHKLGKLKIQEIVEFYEKEINKLDNQPILIGHSYGGLFVQILLDHGYGKKGVAIHPAPPKGVSPYYWSVIKSNLHILRNPLKSRKVIKISQKDFDYAFLNMIREDLRPKIYQEYVIPESGRIFYQSAFSMFNNATKVNFKNQNRSPLLIIAGTNDNIVPKKMVHKNYIKYNKTNSKTDYLEFEGRGHWTIKQDGWKEVAESILNWVKQE